MRKLLSLLAISLILSGCSLFQIHKMDIEQGNVLPPDAMQKLHVGMTEVQVKEMLGTPILLNTFNDNRVDYVYTYKPSHSVMSEKCITLIFRKGRLVTISGNSQ
ncbi:MAG TPA: outer membrane protein assembly factor BamE [Gammaproteobacteria bacterium]|nr:outer membrane protein assembly factor BamE [Gammaproteobacteria bacterium]